MAELKRGRCECPQLAGLYYDKRKEDDRRRWDLIKRNRCALEGQNI